MLCLCVYLSLSLSVTRSSAGGWATPRGTALDSCSVGGPAPTATTPGGPAAAPGAMHRAWAILHVRGTLTLC